MDGEPLSKNAKIQKRALITGITGQDGSYLAELLLSKNYIVYGIIRRSSNPNTQRIAHLIQNSSRHSEKEGNIRLRYADVTDTSSLSRVILEADPNELYNLAAQSHVKVSFDAPEYTADADAVGVIRILDCLKRLGMEKTCRFYQASTSEMYGSSLPPQNEVTPFVPRSPYACAKLYAYYITANYREAYDMFAVNGILFNHESPRRGTNFVTRKITRAVARIFLGIQDKIILGNLYAIRDWGHAKDYVKGMYMMLQADTPDDYVLATGVECNVKEFCNMAFSKINITLEWSGKGIHEVGKDKATGKSLVVVSEQYYRPTEVEYLLGDASKANKNLGWVPETTLDMMVTEMVECDIKSIKKSLT